MKKARDAIESRTNLRAGERADHLAVLWFVAEAEGVPAQVMKAHILEERLMASTLYQSIFEKGEARGRIEGKAEGKAEAYAETIFELLTRWMGTVDSAIRERIRELSDTDILKTWYQDALHLTDAEEARRLAEKIQKAPLP